MDTSPQPPVPLGGFLANLGRVPPAEWMKLLWEDQRQRWQRGECPLVEEYQRGLSPAPGPEALLDLIYGEYVLRKEAGRTPTAEEFSRRFPELAPLISRQLALHDGLSDAEIPETLEGDSQERADGPGGAPVEYAPPPSSEAAYRSRQLHEPPAVPKEIAGYPVVALLDGGAQGAVYRGVHPTLRRDVVIKLGRPCTPGSREGELLVQEGRILAELDDPGLARVFDLKFHEGRPCLVMEFIQGRNLEQDAQRRRRDPQEAALLVACLARAVAAVHRRGVVHRDVKPKNIVIDGAGRPRLIDFGLALLEDAWRQGSHEGGLCGTLTYMAPEQARGEAATAQSDLFALGGVLYYLLTGAAPYTGSTFQDVHAKGRDGDWDRQKLSSRGIPPRLRAVVEKAMAADPAARYASAEELAEALEAAVRPSSGRRWWWLAGAGAAAALLAGVLVWRSLVPAAGPGPVSPPPVAPLEAKKPAEARPFSLEARVWRGRRYANLIDAVPLATGDKVRLEGVAPAGMHAALFSINPAGAVKLLASRPPGDGEVPISYPENPKEAAPLTGTAGNEFILLCARRSGPPAAQDVREVLDRVAEWPRLPYDSVLGLSPQFVKVLQPSRDIGGQAEQADPEGEVRQRLDALRPRLAARFDHFEGLTFAHGE